MKHPCPIIIERDERKVKSGEKKRAKEREKQHTSKTTETKREENETTNN